MIAFLRDVGPRLDRREISRGTAASIDLKAAKRQHTGFTDTLKALGVTVQTLAPLPEQPDGVVVGDSAIILPEVVVMARPNVAARAVEVDSAAATLAEHRPLMRLVPPGCLDAGDVLRIGRTLVVGQSTRTNADCIGALTDIVEPFGYDVQAVELRDGARLKCACSFVPPHFLLVNPAWLDPASMRGQKVVEVDPKEAGGADTFTVAGTTLIAAGHPRTEARLRELGLSVRTVEVSEFHKVEAGLSGLCLLLEPRLARPADASAAMRFVNPAATRAATECFSPAIVHGGLVYVSGQLPVDPLTNKPVDPDIEAQTGQVLRNLGEVLAASGSALPKTIKLTFYLSDLKLADKVKAVCARAFGTHRPTGIFVLAKTPEPGCLIALDAVGAVTDA